MEQDLYAEGHASGYEAGIKAGRLQNTLRADARIKDMKDRIQDILNEVSDFLDNYTDAEYVDGRPVGNRAMNLKASVDELL
jgi:flagellar biosynthesis/type III secretory pathway protein FliH